MVHRTLETEFILTPHHMVSNMTLYINIMTKIMSITLTQCLQPHTVIALIICYFLGHVVAQLVEALCYKLEGRGFDSRWCHWNYSLTLSFQLHYGPGVDSASKRNEYQKYFLFVTVKKS